MSQQCHMSLWQRDHESTQRVTDKDYWLESKYPALISNIHAAEQWGTSQELVKFQKDFVVKRQKQLSHLLESLQITDRDGLFLGFLIAWIILELEQIPLDRCDYKFHDCMTQSGLSGSTSCQVFSNIWIFTIIWVQFLLGLKILFLRRPILTYSIPD